MNSKDSKTFPINKIFPIFFLPFVLIVGEIALDNPGYAASIKGFVKILDREGKLKEDHSGVVIFLDEIDSVPDLSIVNRKPATIRQFKKKFLPEVLPILVGTVVDFPNEDSIFHNVFSLSKAKPFDLGLYKQGTSQSILFDQTGLVKVYCNIHPQMIAYVLVLGNSYFTMSDKTGSFVIENVPLGQGKLRTWYPQTLEHQERQIQITNEGVKGTNLSILQNLEFEIQEEVADITHKNKYGQNYRPVDYPSR